MCETVEPVLVIYSERKTSKLTTLGTKGVKRNAVKHTRLTWKKQFEKLKLKVFIWKHTKKNKEDAQQTGVKRQKTNLKENK